MIDLVQSRQLSERRCWSGTVERIFESLNISRTELIPQVSESVAVFCQERGNIPGHSLSLLMARSLFAAGDIDGAAQILENDRLHGSHAESWLDVLSAEYPFPELYPLFSSRALRPLQLTTAGPLWVLDFNRIGRNDADPTELLLFRTLRQLAETVSNVWKKQNGGGTLGLKGFERFVSPADVQSSMDHVRAVLDRCARKNEWRQTPAVLLIDL